ncbi:PPOX class F420-dependent oxidoreductase [Haloarculaceae archaeon H-GB1-1]|nr:PPOX class F420-dependent oxidoreductase [Haloarculaceae archaeon H-GB1-1]
METIPESRLDLFEKPAIATFASSLPDGRPHVAPVWVDYDGAHLLVVTLEGSRKHKNVQHDPRVTVTVIDPDDMYRYVEVRGHVETVSEDDALEFSDEQAKRYWGVEQYPYSREKPRVLFHIQPERVVAPTMETPTE